MKNVIVNENGKIKVTTINNEPSLARQEFKDQTCINQIMKKYHKTGMIDHLNRSKGQYADLSSLTDYAAALQTVIDAQKSFMTLPSDVRKRFENDPEKALLFLSDANNREEAVKLGLINKPVVNDEKNNLNDKNDNTTEKK